MPREGFVLFVALWVEEGCEGQVWGLVSDALVDTQEITGQWIVHRLCQDWASSPLISGRFTFSAIYVALYIRTTLSKSVFFTVIYPIP